MPPLNSAAFVSLGGGGSGDSLIGCFFVSAWPPQAAAPVLSIALACWHSVGLPKSMLCLFRPLTFAGEALG